MNKKPTVLLVASKWWPLAARLAVALDRHGCEVQALCPRNHLLHQVRAIHETHRYNALDSLGSLRRALAAARPDLIVPCDDAVVLQMHALHARDPGQRQLIEYSLGPAAGYPVIEGRCELLGLAESLGLRVPRHRKVRAVQDLVDWHDDVSPIAVVKVDGGAGGNGVCISRSLSDSIAAFERFRRRPGRATALKRALVDCDPLAPWSRAHRAAPAVSVQEFIAGRPANSMLACWRGKLIGIVSVAVVAAQGATGAATVVRIVQNEKMKNAAEQIAARLGLSGFYGLDFILEAATGNPFLIELNPRCTQLGHLELPRVGSLAGALAAALTGKPPAMATQPIKSELVALFPQALQAGPATAHWLETGHHDVPEDADVRAELVREIWPRRRWISRLYHAFHAPQPVEPALFERVEAPDDKIAHDKTRSVA